MLSSCSKDDLTSLILECDELVLTYVWKAVTPKSGWKTKKRIEIARFLLASFTIAFLSSEQEMHLNYFSLASFIIYTSRQQK